jgi:hypothetical protein
MVPNSALHARQGRNRCQRHAMNVWSVILAPREVSSRRQVYRRIARSSDLHRLVGPPGLAYGEVNSRRLRYFPKSTNGRVLRDQKPHDMHGNSPLFHNLSSSRTKALGSSEGFQGLIGSLVPGQDGRAIATVPMDPLIKPSTYAERRLPMLSVCEKPGKGNCSEPSSLLILWRRF